MEHHITTSLFVYLTMLITRILFSNTEKLACALCYLIQDILNLPTCGVFRLKQSLSKWSFSVVLLHSPYIVP